MSAFGKWEEWITFFLRGVVEQAKAAVDTADAIIGLREQWRQIQGGKAMQPLIDYLFLRPAFQIPQASEQLGIAFHTLNNAVKTLQSLGILHELTGQKRNKMYYAPELLRIFEPSSK